MLFYFEPNQLDSCSCLSDWLIKGASLRQRFRVGLHEMCIPELCLQSRILHLINNSPLKKILEFVYGNERVSGNMPTREKSIVPLSQLNMPLGRNVISYTDRKVQFPVFLKRKMSSSM